MTGKQREQNAVVTVGFAVGTNGAGVAYATVARDGAQREVLRVPFTSRARLGLSGRDVTYDALNAVTGQLLARDEAVSSVVIADERLVDDLEVRGRLPHALTIPYVALRCGLNRLRDAAVVVCPDGACADLTARARADIVLDTAA